MMVKAVFFASKRRLVSEADMVPARSQEKDCLSIYMCNLLRRGEGEFA